MGTAVVTFLRRRALTNTGKRRQLGRKRSTPGTMLNGKLPGERIPLTHPIAKRFANDVCNDACTTEFPGDALRWKSQAISWPLTQPQNETKPWRMPSEPTLRIPWTSREQKEMVLSSEQPNPKSRPSGRTKQRWRLDQDVSLPGETSRQVSARVKGPQLQTKRLVVVEPLGGFDLAQGVDIGVSRGVKLWDPGSPLACRVTNVGTSGCLLSKETTLATVYSVNNFALPRIQALLDLQLQLREMDGHTERQRQARRGRGNSTRRQPQGR